MLICRVGALLGVLVVTALISGCGGGTPPPPPPTITAVNVSPQNPTVVSGQQQQFRATVVGTGSFSSAVTWYVNDVVGGNSTVGTITETGAYQAPSLTSPVTVVIKAVSSEDSTKSGTSQASLVLGLVSSVTIDPPSQNVYAGSTQLFTATVQGTGSNNPNVTWAVNGIPGGNSTVGTVGTGPSAFYTAPDAIPNPSTVTITATSVQDTTKSGTASATVVPPPLGIIRVTVSPTAVNMPAGQTQAFVANVVGVGNFNAAVTWSLNPAGYGSISVDGVYTPPNNLTDPTTINITVTSVADPSKTALASTQVFPTPVITSISPNPAQAGDTVSIDGTNLYGIISINFTGPNNMTLPVASYGAGVTVPYSAVSGPVTMVTQLPGFAPVVTNSVQFTRTTALRIRAAQRDLSTGESTTFSYRVLGASGSPTIQWTVDMGSIDSGGIYRAPGGLTEDTFATVQGCISGTQVCQSEILGLHPFRIAPYPALVPAGNSVQMDSLIGGVQQSATWTQLAGGGSLTPAGLYSAGTAISDTGGIQISAALSGATETATIGATGKVPGVVGEVSDYVDYLLPLPLGTYNEQIAVSGNRLYTLASGTLADYYERTFFWIDVYDISDPTHPVWLDSAETAFRAPMYIYGQYLYQIGAAIGNVPGDVLAIFDISKTRPVLQTEQIIPVISNTTFFGGIFWGVTGWSTDHSQAMLSEFDLRSGNIVEHDFQLAIPNSIGPNSSVSTSAAGTDTQLFVFNVVTDLAQNSNGELDTYDLTTTPPTLLQRQTQTPPIGNGSLFGTFIVAAGEIFDVSSGLPVHISSLPVAAGITVGYNGKQLLASTYQNGERIMDVTDLTQPKLTGVLFDRTAALETATWAGQYVIAADIDLRIYDAAPTGGAIDKTPPLNVAAVTYDQLIYQSRLFVAAETDVNAFVSILDLSTNPATELGRFDTGAANPLAVQPVGSTMYVGTDQSLLVVDVSNPANPVQINSFAGAVNALATSGNYLYAGTQDGHLITYNISQPSSPVQVSSQALPTAPVVMRTASNLLFVADNTSGLLIYNLATPGSPAQVSQFTSGAAIGDLALDGTLALLATADQGLVIIDVTNPAQPLQVGQAIVPSYGFTSASAIVDGITLNNKVAYVGTWMDSGNIYGYDYSVPAHPRMVSVMPEGGVVCEYVLTLQNDGSDLFDGGAGIGAAVTDIDLSQPRNVINSYPIFATSISNAQSNPCNDAAATARSRFDSRSYSKRTRLKKMRK